MGDGMLDVHIGLSDAPVFIVNLGEFLHPFVVSVGAVCSTVDGLQHDALVRAQQRVVFP